MNVGIIINIIIIIIIIIIISDACLCNCKTRKMTGTNASQRPSHTKPPSQQSRGANATWD